MLDPIVPLIFGRSLRDRLGGLTVRAGMSVCLATVEDRYALITVNATDPSGKSVDVTLTVWNSE
jgi:hypothetical protein